MDRAPASDLHLAAFGQVERGAARVEGAPRGAPEHAVVQILVEVAISRHAGH